MSVAKFVPELTKAEVAVVFSNALVVIPTLTPIAEGLIASGNAVTIVGADLPTVQDYAAQGRRFEADDIVATSTKILIDQEKIVPTRVDDIDSRQAAGSLTQFTDLQGVALAKDAESFVIKTMVTEGTSINVVGSAPVTISDAAKARTALRKLAAAMDAAEVPAEGRYVAINPAFKELLVESLSDAAQAGGDNELRKNVIAELSGFTVLWSPNFTEKVKPVAVAYHEAAAAFVSQIAESRAVPATDGHADIVSTLNVYGSKVTRPKGVYVYVSGGTAAVPAE